MDDIWFGTAFEIFEATDEHDLEVAMVVLRGGTHIDKDEIERIARAGMLAPTYRGMRDARQAAEIAAPWKYWSSCCCPHPSHF